MKFQSLLFALGALSLVLPFVCFLVLSAWIAVKEQPQEKVIQRLISFCFVSLVACNGLLIGLFVWNPPSQKLLWTFTLWKQYGIDFSFALQLRELIFLFLSTVLLGLVGKFSFHYLHREKNYSRFFVLLLLFSLGIHFFFLSGSLNVLFIGWELVGLSSVLLIAYFSERKRPVQNAMFVFALYRLGDVSLLLLCIWFHKIFGSTQFDILFQASSVQKLMTPSPSFASMGMVMFFLFLAVSVKSSLFPFFNWLPKAMEGPTPSSAIFYGAISTHMGLFLLLKFNAYFEHVFWLQIALVMGGLITALFATIIGRIQADAKNGLAFATIVQLGIITIEIGVGWYNLALLHMVGHATLRTLQFLKTPSILQEKHEMEALNEGSFPKTGWHLEKIFPLSVQQWIYFFALEHGFVDRFLFKIAIGLNWLSEKLNQGEKTLLRWFGSSSPTASLLETNPSKEPITTVPTRERKGEVS